MLGVEILALHDLETENCMGGGLKTGGARLP